MSLGKEVWTKSLATPYNNEFPIIAEGNPIHDLNWWDGNHGNNKTNKGDSACESSSLVKFSSFPVYNKFSVSIMRFKVTLSGKPTHDAPVTCAGWSSTEEVYSAG